MPESLRMDTLHHNLGPQNQSWASAVDVEAQNASQSGIVIQRGGNERANAGMYTLLAPSPISPT
jgi:hypothetical protein